MKLQHAHDETAYRTAMGRLLVLYTQVDRLIMQACAERIATAPDQAAQLALARQVGDESRHVAIQNEWMRAFGSDPAPVITAEQEAAILEHFRTLDWLDFLTDMYLCVEAMGSDAVEKVVPLADPGTRESLRIPLQDELDHIAFGVNRLRQELGQLPASQRAAYMAGIEPRIDALAGLFLAMQPGVQTLFESVGADYRRLCQSLQQRKAELLREMARPLAA